MPEIRIFGDHESRTIEQLERCLEAEEGARGALCADGHVGYSQPIGGVAAYRDHISVSGVGFDISCVVAGTPVTLADGSWIPIEDVAAGDAVVAWDGRVVRPVEPVYGQADRGVRPVLRLGLDNGRVLHLTGDHLVRTKLDWGPADRLRPGDRVACTPFVGTRRESAGGELAIDVRPAVRERLAARDWWPVRIEDPRFPVLLRILAYVAGDGTLSRDGKRVSLYTFAAGDAESLYADLAALGFEPRLHTRVRPTGVEHHVYVTSIALHGLLAGLGIPVGRKATAWPAEPMPWLFDLPRWMRSHFVSAFASAEATTPALINGRIANHAIKQSGTAPHAAQFVARLLESLDFRVGVTVSGRPVNDAVSHVVQVQGGEGEQLRFIEEIGFCRAAHKRVAGAAVASAAWQKATVVAQRNAAVDAARAMHSAGGATIAGIKRAIAERFDVSPAFAHHAIYDGRGAPRSPKGMRFTGDHSGEVAWVPVSSIESAGERRVFDVITGDPVESFHANGIVVHNCGNKAARLPIRANEIAGDLPRIMDEVVGRISFGVGRASARPVEHPVIDAIAQAEFAPQRRLRDLAARQLGTVGAGNHYVDLFEDEAGYVWVGVHFGSRGFGHKTASGFLALAAGLAFDAHAPEGEMDAPPTLLALDSELGQAYLSAMELAGEYAYAGRDVVVDEVCAILGARPDLEVHNHHNYAWSEEHGGETLMVVRKGATPAFPGQLGFVGASMGEPAVILEGVDSDASRQSLYSTVHGAGRVMSRTKAAGKMRYARVCSERDCDFWVGLGEFRVAREKAGVGEHDRFTLCPRHPRGRMVKRRVRTKPGVVDYDAVRRRIAAQGIELRGGAADEAPDVYKRLDEVLTHHAGTVRIVHRLRPIGVAMAGADVEDPYKD